MYITFPYHSSCLFIPRRATDSDKQNAPKRKKPTVFLQLSDQHRLCSHRCKYSWARIYGYLTKMIPELHSYRCHGSFIPTLRGKLEQISLGIALQPTQSQVLYSPSMHFHTSRFITNILIVHLHLTSDTNSGWSQHKILT